MEKIVFFIILIFIIYLFLERKNNLKKRKSFKYLIHVNGIRGKSTVTRLIDAGVRAGGYKVFTKITGTSPRIIDTNKLEKEINRLGKANIREQIKAISWAFKEKAEVLILECMAVKPELQYICEKKILNSDIGVITNVREDHLDEMGENLDDIAKSLANTIPENGVLFSTEKKYLNFFKREAEKLNSKFFLIDNIKKDYEDIDFPDNVALALAVCKHIGIEEKIALNGMKNYLKDPGKLKTLILKKNLFHIYFVNAMAANDPDSTQIIIDKISKENYWGKNRILLVNNRKDRISRWQQFLKFVENNENKFNKILISGENKNLFKKYLLKTKINRNKIDIVNDIEYFDSIEKDSLIIAIGNICGNGEKILSYFEEKGEEYCDK